MEATFDIRVDPVRHLVRMRLGGLFDPASMQAFITAREVAFDQLRCPVSQHLALTDVREIKIQTQEMVTAFAAVLAHPATRSRRLAFVVAGTLARTQLQRAIGQRQARCFTDPVEAERWLLSEEPAAHAA